MIRGRLTFVNPATQLSNVFVDIQNPNLAKANNQDGLRISRLMANFKSLNK